jgi:drug/metabolite transporter (DMT)-like permease
MAQAPPNFVSVFRRIRLLPGLRSRSNVEFGIYVALLCVLAIAGFASISSAPFLRNPPKPLLEALAGVGATLFVSYTVGMSSLFQRIRRDGETETLLGVLVGLGLAGIGGVGLAVVLLDTATPFGWLGRFALCWAGGSLVCLSGFIAVLPLFAYEDARARHLNPDE